MLEAMGIMLGSHTRFNCEHYDECISEVLPHFVAGPVEINTGKVSMSAHLSSCSATLQHFSSTKLARVMHLPTTSTGMYHYKTRFY